MATLTLLGKPGCHLCHEMAALVARVVVEYGATFVEKDVRDDPETRRRYELEIPVLVMGALEVGRHRLTEEDLRSRLAALGLTPTP